MTTDHQIIPPILYNDLFFKHIHLAKNLTTFHSTHQPSNKPSSLEIGSLNTRGLNDTTKLNCLLTYIKDKNFDLFGLSETKLQSNKKIPNTIDNFIIHSSNLPSSQAGVSIIINKKLQNHLYKTTELQGYIISTFFQFKPKIKLCITQIYLPHNLTERKKATLTLQNLINDNKSKNISHIIMGDFNSTPSRIDRTQPSEPKYKSSIYTSLNKNYHDSFRLLNPQKLAYTFAGPTGQSRIDQIWTSNNISTQITKSQIINTEPEFQSNHKIITLSISNFLTNNLPKSKPIIRYNYNKVSEKTWENINSHLSHKLNTFDDENLDIQNT